MLTACATQPINHVLSSMPHNAQEKHDLGATATSISPLMYLSLSRLSGSKHYPNIYWKKNGTPPNSTTRKCGVEESLRVFWRTSSRVYTTTMNITYVFITYTVVLTGVDAFLHHVTAEATGWMRLTSPSTQLRTRPTPRALARALVSTPVG